jgi:hypothetical protein
MHVWRSLYDGRTTLVFRWRVEPDGLFLRRLARPMRALLSVMAPTPEFVSSSLLAFYRYFMVHLAVRDWIGFIRGDHAELLALACGFTAAPLVSFSLSEAGFSRLRYAVAIALLGKMAFVFPNGSNHFHLELVTAIWFAAWRQEESRDTWGAVVRGYGACG